jgi:hypothetical protein
LSNPFPQGFNLPTDDRDPLSNVGFGISGFIREERVGYTQQWNLSVQQEIGNLLVEAAYLGNKGTSLQFGTGFEENSLHPDHLALGSALNDRVPNPFFGRIPAGALSGPTVARRQLLLPFPQYTSVFRNLPMAASSIYHGLMLKAERRLATPLTLLGSYTWSKHIDDSSTQEGFLAPGGGVLNFYNRKAERSLSVFDTPHRFAVSAVYDLPVGKGRRIGGGMGAALDALLGGWTFSGIATLQSGTPVIISRPSINDGRSARVDNPTIDQWFDTRVFSPGAPFTFGNVSRTLPDVRTDGISNVDFTLSKSLQIGAGYRVQVRVDAFNAFNTPRFGPPNGSVTSPAFGTVTTQANNPREIQLGIKLYF